MVDVRAFPCIRPREGMAQELASLPYDVFDREEAKAEIEKNPLSFLRIDMSEATFDEPIDHDDDAVFEKSRTLLDDAIADGLYITDEEPHYYLYRLRTSQGQCQTGIVGCASIDDYQRGAIKKHEKTRADKEVNRIRHVDVCSAHTGPIFLAYRSDGTIEQVMEKTYSTVPIYDFIADDGVQHTVWRVDDAEASETIKQTLAKTPSLYIADGHHRAASAVKAGLLRREATGITGQPSRERCGSLWDSGLTGTTEQPSLQECKRGSSSMHATSQEQPSLQGCNGSAQRTETAASPIGTVGKPLNFELGNGSVSLESDHFLSVIFPSDQLTILDYNRIVTDLNGLSTDEFLAAVKEGFDVSGPLDDQCKPESKGSFGMYLDGSWYALAIKANQIPNDPVSGLDVAILQDRLLGPILGIEDPRTDSRIDFVGGIRGLDELERRVGEGGGVAFAMYPTSIEELFAVADAGLLMPPKSTWFEPKLRSGIFIHRI